MAETPQDETITTHSEFIEAVDRFADVWNQRQSTCPPLLSSLADPVTAWTNDPQLVLRLYNLVADAMHGLLAYLDELGLEEIVELPEPDRELAQWLWNCSTELSRATSKGRTRPVKSVNAVRFLVPTTSGDGGAQ